MVKLNDKELEKVVGGQSLAEYAIISLGLPNVAEHNPNAQVGVNDHAFNALYKASLKKLIKTLD